MKKILGLFIALNSFFIFSQNDCSDAIVVCGNSGYQDLTVTGFGVQELSNSNVCSSQENNSIWFKLTINTSGTLGFTLTPTSNSINEDFDFFVFGPNVSCGNIGQAIRCSTTNPLAAGQGNNLTGMNGTETDTSEGPGAAGNSFVQWLDVVAGESYFLVIDRPIGTSNFSIDWTGTATFNQQPTFTNPTPETLNIEQCDTDNVLDNISTFDLTVNDNIAIGTQNNVEITYHTSNNDAILGNNKITTPQAFQNTTNPQIIYVRLTNIVTQCYSVAEFSLTVSASIPLGTPVTLTGCDSNNNGMYTFDLSLNNSLISTDPNVVFSYFPTEVDALSNTIANQLNVNYTNVNGYTPETIWVRVENPTTGCYSVTSFNIQVYNSPETTPVTDILQCDDDNDGFFSFDLNALKDAEILNGQSPTEFEVHYFTNQADADANTNPIANPYTNASAYSSDVIVARIQNSLNSTCYQTQSFTIQVFESPTPAVNIPNLTTCDSNAVGIDTDGFEAFDLTVKQTEILNGQNPTDFTVTYFTDSNLTNQIANPTSFVNTNVNSQTIYVSVVNNANNTCEASTSFIIEVLPLPTINASFLFKQCDEDGNPDGFTDFNLDEANTYITLGDNTLTVTYFLSFNDADTNTNPINPAPYSNATQATVFARVENTVGCHRVAQVDLLVSATSFPPNYLKTLTQCDDDDTIDGLHLFDLAQTTAEIIALFPSGQNLAVSFYRNLADAQLEVNQIPTNTPYMSETPFSQTIYVRVESNDNGECFGLGPYLQLIVNPRPEFELDPTAIYCQNLPPATVAIFNPLGNYTYQWTFQDGTVVSNRPEVRIDREGVYTVIATSQFGCESFPHSITITPSIIATVTYDDITVVDDSENNSITIATNSLGIGDYEFAIDDRFGPYQDEPFFDNVAPGIHTIFIRDKNNCGIALIDVSVIGFPRYFTPNGDGVNDTWKILGVNESFYASSNIYIFDRFGKLIAKIDPRGNGWNGIFNGKFLPASDYWFSVELIDNNGNIRTRKGHFSLIRR